MGPPICCPIDWPTGSNGNGSFEQTHKDAPRALALGMVNDVVAEDAVQNTVEDVAKKLANGSAKALGNANRLVNGVTRKHEPPGASREGKRAFSNLRSDR